MRDAHGPLSTLLLTAPLLVVPTLAAVGLPGGGPADEPVGLMLGDAQAADEGLGEFAENGFEEDFGDPFVDSDAEAFGDDPFGDAPQDAVEEGARWAGGEEPPVGFSDDDPLFPGAVTASTSEGTVDPGGRTVENLVPVAPPRASHGLTTTAATASVPEISDRLRNLGADHLELEKFGAGFYFVCTLPSPAGPGGPMIERRFEAEAESAAAAAVDVLAQVRRFRELSDGTAGPADLALNQPSR